MEDFSFLTSGICAFDVKRDPIITAFSALGKGSAAESAAAYCDIVRTLLKSGKTLAEYLYEMLIFTPSDVLSACAKGPSPLREKAVAHDTEIISRLAEYSSERLKAELCEHYAGFDFSALPDFDKGEFTASASDIITYAAENGSGVFAKYKAFSYAGGALRPIESTDPIKLCELKNYEVQRRQVIENTECFLNGEPAQNVLLYGDRGTGKSSTVKAILNEYNKLRMIDLPKNEIAALPSLFRQLREIPLHFIVMIDDLTFSENDDRFSILKASLEGSLEARPANILIYATTNRRKIIKETVADREINGSDSIDESMSLADRFGLFITFSRPNRDGYLDIVKKLADDRALCVPEDKLFACADRFSVKRGGYSPRIAKQFVDWLEGRIKLGMDY